MTGESLEICLRLTGGAVAGVAVRSTRRPTASALLRGRPVAAALDLLPRVFALCGQAQRIAGARAVEAALGLVPDPLTETVRRLRLAAEAVRELSGPYLLSAPRLLGLAPPAGDMAGLWRALERLNRRFGPAEVEAAAAGLKARPWLPLVEAVAAVVARDRLEDFAAAPARLLPALSAAEVAPWLAADDDGAFRARPLWRGAPAETGSLARCAADPAVMAARARHGDGLAARLAARLCDLACQAAAFHRAADVLPHQAEGWDELPPALPSTGHGEGCGVVEAARGTLAHWVALDGGVVRDWRILAPTEWTFHPDGVLSTALVGVAGHEAESGGLRARVGLFALVLDPCVACTVRVEDGHA